MDELYKNIWSEGITNVQIIAIGLAQYNGSNDRWTQYDSIAVVVDPSSTSNTWSTWGASQWDVFFLDRNGEYVTDINIHTWSYEAIYSQISVMIADSENNCSYAAGDLNGDTDFDIIDIVALVNCVLAANCVDIENGCASDIDGDGVWDINDIITLASCTLNANCV